MTRRDLNFLIASAAGGGLSAAEQDAAAILLRTAEVYPALTSYLFEGKSVTENTTGGKSLQTAMEFTAAFQAPNKLRLEFRYPNAGNWLRVSDGEFLLESRSTEKGSKRTPATEWTIRALKSSPVGNFERLSQTAQNPVLARSETLKVDDKAVECDVIQFASHPICVSSMGAEGQRNARTFLGVGGKEVRRSSSRGDPYLGDYWQTDVAKHTDDGDLAVSNQRRSANGDVSDRCSGEEVAGSPGVWLEGGPRRWRRRGLSG